MKISIETSRRLGLRLIDEIPDIQLCRIEGYNGIGKTSAMRLLSLCTGGTPFATNEPAWQTFRDQLGETRVHVQGLRRGASSIEWVLDPADWSTSSPNEPLGTRTGSIRIDGKPAAASDLGSLLDVHCMNAAETPEKILANRVRVAASRIGEWHTSYGSNRVGELDEQLGRVLEILEGVPSAQEAREELKRAERSAEVLRGLEESFRSVALRRDQLREIVQVSELLDDLRNASPEVDSKIEKARKELEESDLRKIDLDTQIATAHEQKSANQKAEREFELAQKHQLSMSDQLRRASALLSKAASAANVDATSDAIAEARHGLTIKLSRLEGAKPYVNTTPMLISLIENLIASLDDAIGSNIGAETLLEFKLNGGEEAGPSLTVVGTRDALIVKLTKLKEVKPSSNAAQLEAEISATKTRLSSLSHVEDLLEAYSKAEEKLESASRRLLKATTGLPDSTADVVSNLVKLRTAEDLKGRSLQSQIDSLTAEKQRLGGGKSEEALAAELDRLCQRANADLTRVHGALAETEARANELEQDAARAKSAQASASRAATHVISRADSAIAKLTDGDRFPWLRDLLTRISESTTDSVQRIELIDGLRARLMHARDRVENASSAVQAIGGAFEALAERLEAHEPKRPSDWDKPVGAWLSAQVTQWFDDEIMRDALFDGGNNVSLDASQLTLSWKLDGQTLHRPLSGFSSGEQAIAHTRAQLAQLERDADSVANRLIAIDEFGSYLDRRRLTSLTEYLHERQARTPYDQVLVILPYGSVSIEDTGDPTTLAIRTDELARRGYFAEALRP